MLIGILMTGRPKQDEDVQPHCLVEAGQTLGHGMLLLHEPEIVISKNQHQTEILHMGALLPKLDVIINRPGYIEEPSLHTITTEALANAGYKIINRSPLSIISKNKLAQHIMLAKAGVPMPSWAIVRRPDRAMEAAEKIGFPLIIKVAFGTHGKGVFYAENLETLKPIVDYLAIRDRNPIILEKFIAEADRKDLRIFIVGNEVVAAMQRTAVDHDIRANASLGGVGSPVELTEEEKKTALEAAKTFALDIAGVDMLRSESGSLVIEVNANPGFEELERATGQNVAEAIIKFATQDIPSAAE